MAETSGCCPASAKADYMIKVIVLKVRCATAPSGVRPDILRRRLLFIFYMPSTVTTASVGSSSMSASTMPRASLSSRSWPTSAGRAPSSSWRLPSLIAELGIRIERVMTDNGSCYRSKTFGSACKRLGLRQIFTRPYTPKTMGKRALHPNRASRMGLWCLSELGSTMGLALVC